MNWLKTAAIVIWIRAHSDLLFRGLISLGIFFILNSIYRKYEAVLLVTNPEKLFIPLYIYTFTILPLRIWDQKDFVKEIVAVNFELFKSAPRHIKESRDKVLEAAKVDGRIIGFIKTNMRNDPEVAMTAVNSHADAKNYLFKKTKIELGLI